MEAVHQFAAVCRDPKRKTERGTDGAKTVAFFESVGDGQSDRDERGCGPQRELPGGDRADGRLPGSLPSGTPPGQWSGT